MVDTCVIRRRTGETTDPNTGQTTPTYSTVHTGKCRVKMTTTLSVNPSQDRETGQQSITVTQMLLQVPFSVTGIQVEDEVEITASLDPDLVGRKLRVDGPFGQTHATMRRYLVEEVT